jgi:hypothetical protein
VVAYFCKVKYEGGINMSKQQIYDVIVLGGGLSGVAAAIAASREGAKVLLIEQYGFLGGMATAGLVNPFMPYVIWKAHWEYDWREKVNQGIFREILSELSDLGGLHENNQTFNEEILKIVLDRLMKKYSIKTLFHSYLSKVQREGSKILGITVVNKSGETNFTAKYFVDSTGDADLSFLAGCEYKIGREEDNLCQPMTLCFRLASIDFEEYNKNESWNMINGKYAELKRKGLISNPREDVLTFKHMADGAMHFNSTRIINKTAVNAEDLTNAEIEGREQMYELFQFMKKYVPGFKNSQILMSAPQIGVRESRRIVGEYTINEEDLISVKKFEDSVARGTYPVDIHNPSGTGTVLKDIPYGDYYTIPYRALIPKGVDNLIVSGRPISSTHEAHSAYRIMPICTSIGEGAGTAAAIAVKMDISFKTVPYKAIQDLLDKYKALY